MLGARVAGTGIALPGMHVPGETVTNDQIAAELIARRDDLVTRKLIITPDQWGGLDGAVLAQAQERWKQFETSDAWIRERTGVETRPRVAPGTATSDLATAAARMAIENAGWKLEDVEFVIVATVSPDHNYTPPTAALVQQALGIPTRDASGNLREIDGFDVTCACTSFGRALKIAFAYLRSGLFRRGLVIGADVMSTTVTQFSRAALPIFGDVGAALAIEATSDIDDAHEGDMSFFSGLDGSLASVIITPVGGSREPLVDPDVVADPFNQGHRFVMEGGRVRKLAVRLLLPHPLDDREKWPTAVVTAALAKAGLGFDDIDFFAFHQANLRIIEDIEDKLRKGGYKGIVYNNIHHRGNTTSATIPSILHEASTSGVLKRGMRVMIVVFGGGFSWETAIFRW